MKKEPRSIEPILAIIKKILAARPEIIAAYLYGSYAKGYARPDSDVDIAVMTKPNFDLGEGYNYMFNLENEVNEKVTTADPQAPSVEVIPLALMSYPLKYTSSLFGQVIYGGDNLLRIREQEKMRRDFEDLRIFHHLRHEYLMAGVRERLKNAG